MSGLTIPVLAPSISAETGLNPGLIGLYTAILYGGSMISALAGGGFLLRFGALRVSQVSLLVVAIGLLINAPGHLFFLVFGALVIGLGGGHQHPQAPRSLLVMQSRQRHPLFSQSSRQVFR